MCDCVLSVQTLEGCEILLGPEVTYGPPGLDLLCPVAMTIAHCAEVDTENWNIQLKRKTQDSKWEVRAAGAHTHLSSTTQPVRISAGLRHGARLSAVVFFLNGSIGFVLELNVSRNEGRHQTSGPTVYVRSTQPAAPQD